MPNFIENIGLDFLLDDEEAEANFVAFLAQNGKAISGYYGVPSFLYDKGSIDLFLKTEKTEDGKFKVAGIDTHCSGSDFWEMRNVGIDITPKDSLPTERVFMFKNHKDGSGFVPIHLINADVLPSFLKDDVVKMQMCAFPLDINYYADEDDYANNQPKDKAGKHWLLEDGALFPAGFLSNHTTSDGDEDSDHSTDDQVLFKGTVKKLYRGSFEINGDRDYTHILCVIDTQFGELQFAHTINQIEPKQRENIKIGAIVFGACVLSGDVAILDYENGIVKDFDNNFRLLRQVIVNGQAERMRPILCEDAVYISDSSEKTYNGIDEIIDRLNYVRSVQKDRCFATPATITQADCEALNHLVGARCILISYKEEENYEAIAFIDITEEGEVKRIHITNDERYKFKADEKPCNKSIFDDIKLPESVVELICNRAKFHGMLDNISIEALITESSDISIWRNNAARVLDDLMKKPRADIDKNFENIFGYLFAKAIEMTFNDSPKKTQGLVLAASYIPEDAFIGEISTDLSEDLHQKIVSAMDLGKQFYNDFENFVVALHPSDEELMNTLVEALIIVQAIGKWYAPKHMKS